MTSTTANAYPSSAAASGVFHIGGHSPVRRLGFGAMRITGTGIWGEPADKAEALRVLHRARDLDITLIDTADSYGPEVSENLIREALHPYNGMLIATKGGLTRPGPNVWKENGRPEYLRACVLGSLKRLGLSQIPLWQLHRIDPKVAREDQFGTIAEMRAEGLIKHVGLSQVSIEDIKAAQAFFPVASVQNLYNLTNRASEDVLNVCETENIGFIPWYPLANGALTKSSSKLTAIAAKYQAKPGQIALAWLLKRSPVMLPIPGTGSVKQLEDNTTSAGIELTPDDFETISAIG